MTQDNKLMFERKIAKNRLCFERFCDFFLKVEKLCFKGDKNNGQISFENGLYKIAFLRLFVHRRKL